MFHFISMDWTKAHEHLNCVYISVNSDKAELRDVTSGSILVKTQVLTDVLDFYVLS